MKSEHNKEVRSVALDRKTRRSVTRKLEKLQDDLFGSVGKSVDPKPLLSRLYRIVDDYNAAIPREQLKITCRRGCNHCCYIPVEVCLIEAAVIAESCGHQQLPLADRTIPVIQERTPCPFLKDGECSVYEVRPLACRMKLSGDDPAMCEPFEGSHQLVAAQPAFLHLYSAFVDLSHQYVNQVYGQVSGEDMFGVGRHAGDIRQFFPTQR
ncbi:YkgJ family cysteine cluster protein [Ferrimonas marina]|uniref:Putative zinc-or iron-chelating domain-containing protein n=1 Tax=Ferrimonas marina TaxID=299255 RepID=A0A1M5UJN1_9GAMM|nr:YkgJ family cysteine cluster protein [Ferrimonas marina]SHH63215.1 Putative zinc-or iron-chelating domain-containing protein [Ferrimonas marina]